jgi:hypothetical protein
LLIKRGLQRIASLRKTSHPFARASPVRRKSANPLIVKAKDEITLKLKICGN